MKDQNRDEDLLFLDRELKAMAADVPDMPESFRSGWRQAVRAEAEKQPPAPQQAAPSPASRPLSRKWIGLLSAAAALVFLFAGTLATRGILSPRLRRNVTDAYSAPDSFTVKDSMEEDSAAEAVTEYPLMSPVPETDFTEAAEPVFYSVSYESAEESSGDAHQEYAEEAAVPEEEYALATGAQPTFYGAASESAMEITPEPEHALKASGTALSREAAGNSAALSADTADSAPQNSPVPPLTPMGSDAAGELPPSGFRTEFVYFMEDMGAFLLAALPYLLGAGLLLLVFLLLRKKRKE